MMPERGGSKRGKRQPPPLMTPTPTAEEITRIHTILTKSSGMAERVQYGGPFIPTIIGATRLADEGLNATWAGLSFRDADGVSPPEGVTGEPNAWLDASYRAGQDIAHSCGVIPLTLSLVQLSKLHINEQGEARVASLESAEQLRFLLPGTFGGVMISTRSVQGLELATLITISVSADGNFHDGPIQTLWDEPRDQRHPLLTEAYRGSVEYLLASRSQENRA